MCTLHYYRNNKRNTKIHTDAIAQEWNSNPDGSALLFVRKHPATGILYAAELIQSLDLAVTLRYLQQTDAYSVFVHLRGATTATTGLPGCHGFHSPYGDYTVFHNGVIPNPDGYRVDSIRIGEFLEGEVFSTMEPLNSVFMPWNFCNLLVWDNVQNRGYAHASQSGNLFKHPVHGISTRSLGTGWNKLSVGWYPLQ